MISARLGVCVVLGGSMAQCGGVFIAASESTPARSGAEVAFEYVYDVARDDTPSVTLRPGAAGVVQPICVPNGMTRLSGVWLKVQRAGRPGDLVIEVVRDATGERIGTGRVSADGVSGLLEFWEGPDFTPAAVTPGERLLLRVRVGASSGSRERSGTKGSYRLFGARPGSYFGTPVNTYGTERLWAGLEPIFNDRTCLAFQLLTPGRAPVCEEPFQFARAIASDPREEWALRRIPQRKAGPDEVEITGSWRLVPTGSTHETIRLAAEDLPIFLREVMGVGLRPTKDTGGPTITLAIDPTLDGQEAADETHRIEMADDALTVTGKTPRGVLRGVFYVEDVMRLAGAPVLKKGAVVRRPRYSPRITCTAFLINTELLGTESAYTDGHLSRMARCGFNAIWLYCNLCEVAYRSKILPELATAEAGRRVQRIRELARRASRYGIDLVLYTTTYTPSLAGKPRLGPEGQVGLDAAFYERHPEVKGVGMYRSMCTSVKKTRDFYTETTRNLVDAVPGVRALVIIVTGEGFGHCYMRSKGKCPRCHQRMEADVIGELVQAVLDGAGVKAQITVWPYAGQPKTGDLFRSLPKQAAVQPDISKGGRIEIEGVTTRAYDYSISLEGPTPLFQEHARRARDAKLTLWAKVEHAISLELVHVSHIPCYPRWVRRWEALHRVDGLSAVWANWMHYGFTPSLAAELFGWYAFTPKPDGETLLHSLARRDFGEAAVEHVISAWRHFDKAIGQFPFSPQVVIAPGPIQQGPAHPLWLDPNKKVPHRHRAITNSMAWVKPWGPSLCLKRLTAVRDHWRAGVTDLEQALALAPSGTPSPAALREVSMSRAIGITCEGICNLLNWQLAREAYWASKDATEKLRLLDRMEAVARADLKNARAGLELARTDSRYGYANYGRGEQSGLGRGGTFTAVSIQRKIAQVEHMLNTELPKLRERTKGDR